jgi:hypothetical protein
MSSSRGMRERASPHAAARMRGKSFAAGFHGCRFTNASRGI